MLSLFWKLTSSAPLLSQSIEAAIVQLFVEAKRHKPSVLYIPSLSQWAHTMSEMARSTVKALLDSLAPSDPVMLLAVVDGNLNDLPRDVKAWFGYSKENRVALKSSSQVSSPPFLPSSSEPPELTYAPFLRSRLGTTSIFLRRASQERLQAPERVPRRGSQKTTSPRGPSHRSSSSSSRSECYRAGRSARKRREAQGTRQVEAWTCLDRAQEEVQEVHEAGSGEFRFVSRTLSRSLIF